MGDSPWSGLASKAKVKVETGAALEAAKACSTAIEVFKGCQNLFRDHDLNNYDESKLGGSQVDAGPPLRYKFISEATQAKDLLGRYIDSLEDMVSMFKAAGESYTDTDQGSGDNIAALKGDLKNVNSSPGAKDLKGEVSQAGGYYPAHWEVDVKVRQGTGMEIKMEKHNYDIETANVPKHAGTATAESVGVRIPVRAADNMSWRDMYDLGQRISWQEVANDAPIWEAMAHAVHGAAYDLEQKLGEITSDRWESQGGDAAFAAISTFGKSAMTASDSFTMMQQNLEYTANWLYATKVSMPIDKEDKCDDDLQENRDRYQRHYVDGVTQTEKLFPAVAEPAAPKGPVAPPENNNNNNNNNNGNNNGNNNAGGGGGNSGGAGNSGGSGNSGGGGQQQAMSPAALAAQQSAQQAAQQAAAELQQNSANGSQQGATGQTAGSIGSAGSTGSSAGSSGSGSGDMSSILSAVMSAVTSAVSSLTQALPSLATALQQVSADTSGTGATSGLPDFTQLGNLFGQFPDLTELLSQSPEINQLITDNPALSPLAELLGIETATTAVDGAGVPEADAEAAVDEAFPRASLPDFSNLSGLDEVVTPLTGLFAESMATEAPAQVIEAPVESVEVGSTDSIAHARPEAQA